MVKIINSESIISLRVLEWVVTKSSSNCINIKLSDNEYYSINIMYKAQLKSYKKKNFDFFRRDKKFRYIYETTVGQLNFFKWAIENDILKYIWENYDLIENDMNNSLKNLYKKKDGDPKRRKRTELSISATKKVNKHNVSIVVSFD